MSFRYSEETLSELGFLLKIIKTIKEKAAKNVSLLTSGLANRSGNVLPMEVWKLIGQSL
jgi:hypothetical protein